MYEGASWKKDDIVLYDDNTMLVFNNEKDSSIAAITTPDDVDGTHTTVEHLQAMLLPDLT